MPLPDPLSLYRLDGEVAFVTGAGSSIGRAAAHALAAEVVCADIDAEAAAKVAAEIGGRAEILDVADEAAVEAAIEFASAAGPLTALVNSVGISRGKPALYILRADWEAVQDVNVAGSFLVARAAVHSAPRANRQRRLGARPFRRPLSRCRLSGLQGRRYQSHPRGRRRVGAARLERQCGCARLDRHAVHRQRLGQPRGERRNRARNAARTLWRRRRRCERDPVSRDPRLVLRHPPRAGGSKAAFSAGISSRSAPCHSAPPGRRRSADAAQAH